MPNHSQLNPQPPQPHQVSYVKVRALIKKWLYLKNWDGNIFKYLKNSGNPVSLNFTEPPLPAKTEPVSMSNEAIIALREDAPKGVTL